MHPGAVPIPSGWARYCISISENHCWCKVYEFGYNQCYCFWRCAPGPSPRSPAICPAIPSYDASALVAFHSYPDMVPFDPYSGGPTFFGHARCTANLSDEIREFGWLAFGGNTREGNKVIVDPRGSFRVHHHSRRGCDFRHFFGQTGMARHEILTAMRHSLHSHVVYLENTVQDLRNRLTGHLSPEESEDLTLLLVQAESALEHYRKAYELETGVSGPEPPNRPVSNESNSNTSGEAGPGSKKKTGAGARRTLRSARLISWRAPGHHARQ